MFPCETANSCIISNGSAAMGIAVPGTIAAKLLFPDRRVIAVTGDGGFLMNSRSLKRRYGCNCRWSYSFGETTAMG